MKDKTIMKAIVLLPDFVPHAKLVWEYAEKFRIGPPFNAHKLVRILNEVHSFWKDGAFDYQKRRYEISRDGMAEAVRTVCNAQIKGALTNHNYLKKIMIDIAEKERGGRLKNDERKLRNRESGTKDRSGGGLGRWSVEDIPGKIGGILRQIDGQPAADDR